MSAELEWPLVDLEDVADEITVGFVGSMADEYRSTGVPFFRSLNIKPFRIEKTDLKFISPEFHHRIRKSKLTPGDVVIIRTGDPGTATVIPEEFEDANCSDLVIVRPSKKLNAHFLAYFINAVAHHQVAAEIVGAVQQHFNVGSAKRLKLRLPPRKEQDAIAEALRVFDRKLELNRQMNRTLEETAAALYRSWFVDFDPVVAKAAGRAPAHLSPALAALFPAAFQDSDLGPIPKGWVTSGLDCLASISSGKRPTGRSDVPSNDCLVPLFGGGGPMGYLSSPLYRKPIILTGRVGTLGIIFRTSGPSWPSDNTLIVDPVEGVFNFTYFTLKGFDLVTLNRGSTQPLLTQGDLKLQQFAVPPAPLINQFEETVTPLFAMITANDEESQTLAALRDTLLPKLLSGEVRVKEAEKLVEARA